MKCKHSIWHKKMSCEEKLKLKPKRKFWFEHNDDRTLGYVMTGQYGRM